jgi:hypothetical protein
MNGLTKRVEKLEEKHQAAVMTWREFVERARAGEDIPGWDEFVKSVRLRVDWGEEPPPADALVITWEERE